MTVFWDAHCHLLDARLDGIREQVLDRALQSGIKNFWLGGYSPIDWTEQVEWKKTVASRANIFTSFGLHPWWVAKIARTQPEEVFQHLNRALVSLRKEISFADTLGELGLDFHPQQLGEFPEACKEAQSFCFRAQLAIARLYDKPLVLHIVRAHKEALEILAEAHGLSEAQPLVPVQAQPLVPVQAQPLVESQKRFRGIVHSFGADLQTARKYIALGLTPSVSASMFKDGPSGEQTKKALMFLPLGSFVLETDSPDQGLPFTKNLNEPMRIHELAEAIAKIKSTTAQKVLEASADQLVKIMAI